VHPTPEGDLKTVIRQCEEGQQLANAACAERFGYRLVFRDD
jgi:hypothetical protein